MGELHLLLTALAAFVCCVHGYLPTYYMDEWCATTLDLAVQGIEAGRLLLRPPSRGLRYLNCYVFLKAPPGKRISFLFKGFDIQSPFDCDTDFLQLFDDRFMKLELTGRMCNGGLLPEGMYTTTSQHSTVRLTKKNYLADQMELIFTAFHLAPCRGGEFFCANSHCIAESLYCNDYDNCGDRSDICLLNTTGIIAVVVCAVILVILIAVIVAVILYRRQQHRRMEKLRMRQLVVVQDGKGRPVVMQEEHLHYVDVWDKKSSLSHSLSTSSSRLSKDSNMGEDTLTKKPLDSFRSHKHGSNKHSTLRSSVTKKSKSQNGTDDIYAVPRKQKKSDRKKKKKSSVKYINNPDLNHHNLDAFIIPPFTMSLPAPEMVEKKASFRDGMKGQTESDLPVHTLDPATLPGADQHLHGPDVYDHVVSFRSYTSPEQRRKERVVYLYPGGHPGYHRLHQHGHEEATQPDRLSTHSSRSSLVKL